MVKISAQVVDSIPGKFHELPMKIKNINE